MNAVTTSEVTSRLTANRWPSTRYAITKMSTSNSTVPRNSAAAMLKSASPRVSAKMMDITIQLPPSSTQGTHFGSRPEVSELVMPTDGPRVTGGFSTVVISSLRRTPCGG